MWNFLWIIFMLTCMESRKLYNDTNSLNSVNTTSIPSIANLSSLQSIPLDSTCLQGQYRCWDGSCIPQERFCDDVADCNDKSDEFDYEFLTKQVYNASVMASILPCIPPQTKWLMKSVRPCALMNTWICDGIKDQCVGDIDEDCWNATSSRCLPIPESMRCNGYQDCYDGSDEENCTQYRCAAGNATVLEKQLCDGTFHCSDTSDECFVGCSLACYCPQVYQSCRGNSFCEVENPEHCVSCADRRSLYMLSQMCDGTFDCPDKSDEVNCTKFKCKNDNEVWDALRCDTRDDCGDTSDECGCPNTFGCHNSNCISMSKTCDGVNDCGDHSDECVRECAAKHRYTCANDQCIAAMSFCDDIPDCSDGSDEWMRPNKKNSSQELMCNNIRNTVEKTCVLKQKTWMCDMSEHCVDRLDECQPGCGAQSFWCDDGKCLKVEAFCNGIKDCDDGSDERLYDNKLGDTIIPCVSLFSRRQCCLDARHPWICDVFTHCVNRTDECTSGCPSTYTCKSGECIDRSWVCDGDQDCFDGSDEDFTSGEVFQCTKTRHPITRVCHLPLSISKDNISDCDRNMDQIGYHKMDAKSNTAETSANATIKLITHRYFQCIGESRYIPGESQCDGKYNCPLLSDECLCENSPSICDIICYKSQPVDGAQSPCSICEVGEILCDDKCISRLQVCNGINDCNGGQDEEFCIPKTKCPEGEGKNCTFEYACDAGVAASKEQHKELLARQCDGRPQCTNLEDECSEQCFHQNVDFFPEFCNHMSTYYDLNTFKGSSEFYSCRKGGIVLEGPNVCDGFSRDCPGGQDELNCPGRIYCDGNDQTDGELRTRGAIHIDPSQKCDGKIDCENNSDEKNCSNHYYCEGGHPYFVPLRAVMDGKDDCYDGSDECPPHSFTGKVFSSREQMIRDPVLSYLIWLMGSLSIVGNLAVLAETIYGLVWSQDRFKNKRAFAKVNHVLVINLALADLLMGLYLVILGSEAASRTGSYCQDDKSWRSSTKCDFLGVLTVMSSVTSVLILLILTSYRLYGVMKPFKCQHLNYLVTLGFAAAAWITSFTLAVVPITKSSYKSHAWIKHNPYFLHDVVSKRVLLQFVRKLPLFYTNDMKNRSIHFDWTSSDDSWESIKTVMTSLFGKDAIRGEFGYYSHVSVCMPKIYVTKEDVAWEHSMVIICFNCVAFTYIVAAYAFIFFKSITTMKTKSSRRQRSMFRRISYLVASDLTCWLPICVMAFMNFSGYTIPENAYAISAVILLPINSAVNPLLYSNVVQNAFVYIITCGEKKKESLQTSFKGGGESKDGRCVEKMRLTPPTRNTSLRVNSPKEQETEFAELNKQMPDVVADSFSISGKEEEQRPLHVLLNTSSKL